MKIQDILIYTPAKAELMPYSSDEGLYLEAGTIFLIEKEGADIDACTTFLSKEKLHAVQKIPVLILENTAKHSLAALDRIQCGDISIEVLQIKTLENGELSLKLIKGRVLSAGELYPTAKVVLHPKIFHVCILTLSDRAFRGEYEDRSGPEVERLSREHFSQTSWKAEYQRQIIPDDADLLRSTLQDAIDRQADLIITTGGTGVGPRDITPEVVRQVIDKEIPGIMEMIRLRHGTLMPRALLSRAVAGVKGESLIFAIPGSTGAVRDYMAGIHETLDHLFFMVRGVDIH